MKTHEYKGHAYFSDLAEARDFGAKHAKGFPSWRVVEYERGFAVQLWTSGDYLALNGKPTLDNNHYFGEKS